MEVVKGNLSIVNHEYNGVTSERTEGQARLVSLGSGKKFIRDSETKSEYFLADLEFEFDGEITRTSAAMNAEQRDALVVGEIVSFSVSEDSEGNGYATILGHRGAGKISASVLAKMKASATPAQEVPELSL
tara:strand:+ start:3515 stop:3907 length:393 start_codon:yes stop_codon:yes gene_type:complete